MYVIASLTVARKQGAFSSSLLIGSIKNCSAVFTYIWFLQNATRYDHYDRSGPKIFVGEYAAQSDRIGSPNNVNNWKTALSEAAFMTGLERNAAVVTMASYAPLFGHVRDWQWTPNLIWFDNSRSCNTPNYYVQQLFSVNKGTAVVPLLLNGQPVTGQDSCWASAVVDATTHELILKWVNMSNNSQQKTIELKDTRFTGPATVTTLQNADLAAVNNLDQPARTIPAISQLPVKGTKMQLSLPPYSLTVLRAKL